MDRRDQAAWQREERREQNAYARRLRAATQRMEHGEEEERIFTDASGTPGATGRTRRGPLRASPTGR